MVDSVRIDTAYKGEVFTVARADVPERKTDLVAGVTVWDAPAGGTTVAVQVKTCRARRCWRPIEVSIRVTLAVNQARYVVPQPRQMCCEPLSNLGQGG